MFVYEEIENKCEEFIYKGDWYAYPWHSDPGGVVLPGEFISKLSTCFLYESHDIIRKCYDDVGLQCLKFQFDKDLYIPDLDLSNKDEISEVLNVPLEMINYNLIEAAIIGYLRSKNITVQGIVYGSEPHNYLNNYIKD